MRTLLAVSKNLHFNKRGGRNTKKMATVDLGKSDSPPQAASVKETSLTAGRRATFDEQACRSFAENPGIFRKKIAEHKKAKYDELTVMMAQIQGRFLNAAQSKFEKTQERLQDARKLLGDPEKVKEVKSSLDQRVRYDSLCSYVESSQKARKYLKKQAKMAADDANERETKNGEKAQAIASNIQNKNHMRQVKISELKELNKKRDQAVANRNARLEE